MSSPISLSKTTKIPIGKETNNNPKITESSAVKGIPTAWSNLFWFCN
ncbi:hypothetical protein AAA799B03_01410, partial [Marine Group I thaumarchaeote SCGC AAA799-B03]